MKMGRFNVNISVTAKVIVGFLAVCVAVLILDSLIPGFRARYFTVGTTFSFKNPLDYFRLISHVFGHADWSHLYSNMLIILIAGFIVEEKYGSDEILGLVFGTALITGIINVIFFSHPLCGASGIAVALVILTSIVGRRKGAIPLEFLLVVAAFLIPEVYNMFKPDRVSQMGHLIGGFCGASFGFSYSAYVKPRFARISAAYRAPAPASPTSPASGTP